MIIKELNGNKPQFGADCFIAENAVINNSQTTNRRINWMIGLEYRTTSEQLKNIKNQSYVVHHLQETYYFHSYSPY